MIFVDRVMSTKRQQLFVGVIDNNTWTVDTLCTNLMKHACVEADQYITDCEFMSYSEERFRGKSFAFVTFTHEICVDVCMKKRQELSTEYGITMKRLLPDSISKCERLVSTPDIVIRIPKFDQLFTDENIRSYFDTYGKILDLKMLEEENTGGICLLTFEDFDSSDRVLLDSPHYLNQQILSVHKYSLPEYICSLSQFRFVDSSKAQQIKKWYPYVRNLTDLIHPLTILYRTQIALTKFHTNKQISIGEQNLNQSKENLIELENNLNNIKQDFLSLSRSNEQIQEQVEENQRKNDQFKEDLLMQIEKQRERNRSLQDAIQFLEENV